jgi:mono/diheme cytochrome c family protein
MKKRLLLAISMGLLSTGVLAASQGAGVFEEVCAACHGEKGQGIPGLAPPLKGSEFVTKTDAKALADFIQKGRTGKDKKFPQFPSDMPPYGQGAAKAQAVADYVKGDLQK